MEIVTLREGRVADVVALYNRGVEHNPYSARLDEQLWETVIAPKMYYRPDDVLLAYEHHRPLGYVHLCHGPNADRTAPDISAGSIEALFFDPARPDVGAALLHAAVERHRTEGARKVWGLSSSAGYPLYRGVFVGLEPLVMERDQHVVAAFVEAGFRYCQRSVEMVVDYEQPVLDRALPVDAQWNVAPWTLTAAWEAATWLGLEPWRIDVECDGTPIAFCVYAMMPTVSRAQGVQVGCIGGLWTAEAWRRKGIAAFLVAKALNHMFEGGARRVTLGTGDDNWAAHATYRQLGFKIEERICGFVLEFATNGA